MEIQFRKLDPNESLSYRKLRLQCLKDYPKFFGSNYQDEKKKEKLFFQQFIEVATTNTFVVGAFNNSRLVGISVFQRNANHKTSHGGIIFQVYVHPEFQGQSIGSNIIRFTLNEAFKIEGVEQVEIGVIATNEKAHKVYEKIGFESFGLQKNYLKVDQSYYDHRMMIIFKSQFINQ